jgi:hypothetical protein
MEKYGRTRQATNDNTYSTCGMTKRQLTLQTPTHNMLYVLLFHGNNGYANAPQCYVYTYIACLINICVCVGGGAGLPEFSIQLSGLSIKYHYAVSLQRNSINPWTTNVVYTWSAL